jgi:hypothetical protein
VTRRTLVWAVLLTGLTAWLCFVPLFDVLGFELAFAVAIAASLAAADLGAKVVAEARRVASGGPALGPAGTVALLYLLAALRGLALLVVPLVVACLNALRVRNCDFAAGFGYWAALPGISVLLGAAAGVTAGLLFSRRWLGGIAAWAIVVGSLVWGVARFYAAPPIFGYDPFAGYFPGSLYDEHIVLGTPFWASRLYQIGVALFALSACAALLQPRSLRLGRPEIRRGGPLAVCAGAATLVFLLGEKDAEIGFHADAPAIAQALGGRKETAHFVIFYPARAPFAAQMDAIAAEHELRFAQVERVFGVAPREKITSYYFASAQEKARWMGAANVYIAKPWRHEIYLQHDTFPHPVLRHEIAHVFAGEFGDPLFHVSVSWGGWPPAAFNVGLIEGIAVAADWPTTARLTPHQSVRAALEAGTLPPLRSLLTTGFLTFSSAQSYTTAGSFVRFLLLRDGAEKLRALYRSGGRPADFQAIYGRPLDELERAWHEEVKNAPLAHADRELARERFRRPGIFRRPCPHAVAKRQAQVRELEAAGDHAGAQALQERVCADEPGEPGHRLDLAGLLERAGDLDAASAILREIGHGEWPSPLRARTLLRLIDLEVRRARLAEARAELEAALALPVDEATRRNLLVRREALGDGPAAPALRAYLFAGTSGEDPVVQLVRAVEVTRTDPGLGLYLQGRILHGKSAWSEARRVLVAARAAGLAEPLVARENDRLLASAAFLDGDLDACRQAAERLRDPAQPLAVRWEGEDWLARVAFRQTGALPPAPELP